MDIDVLADKVHTRRYQICNSYYWLQIHVISYLNSLASAHAYYAQDLPSVATHEGSLHNALHVPSYSYKLQLLYCIHYQICLIMYNAIHIQCSSELSFFNQLLFLLWWKNVLCLYSVIIMISIIIIHYYLWFYSILKMRISQCTIHNLHCRSVAASWVRVILDSSIF